jgi:hypothetical protein
MVQKEVIKGLRSIAKLLLSLGSHCKKVKNSVESSENKNMVVGYLFYLSIFFILNFSYVGCSSGLRGCGSRVQNLPRSMNMLALLRGYREVQGYKGGA